MTKKQQLLYEFNKLQEADTKIYDIILNISMPNGETETIKNPNVQQKISYICNTYNNELVHKNSDQIKIESWKFNISSHKDIGSMMDCLKNGLRMRKTDWLDYEYIYYDQMLNQILNENGEMWTPTVTDLFAKNWIEYKDGNN